MLVAPYQNAIMYTFRRCQFLTCNDTANHNAEIYGCLGIINNHRLSFIKVPPIIDYEMIANSHHSPRLLATDQLLLHCSSSVCLSIHPKCNSGTGDTAQTTGPIYFVGFFKARSFWVDNARLFHFLNSVCNVCWNRQKTDCGLLYLITCPPACC